MPSPSDVAIPPMDVSREYSEQARHDLDVALLLQREKRWSWACYLAQQAAEKAVKSVRVGLGTDKDELKKPNFGHDGRLLDSPASTTARTVPLRPPANHRMPLECAAPCGVQGTGPSALTAPGNAVGSDRTGSRT